MKKMIIAFIVVIFVFGSFLFVKNANDIEINSVTGMNLIFNHKSTEINQQLTDEDSQTIISILNDHHYINRHIMGELSCGFSEEVCLTADGEIYELACDGCPYIFAENSGKYIELTDEERDTIAKIVQKNGGYFPCV